MICNVYQMGDDPDHLLLVDADDVVINGEWHLSYARERNYPHTLVGNIDYEGNYNDSLVRFRNGERAVWAECECCGVGKWETKQNGL
jgi:hypothetical protein